jgi:hypothetical protein
MSPLPGGRAPDSLSYGLLADTVLGLHVGLVLFVVGGFVLILVGNLRGWRWVNALHFRVAHLAAIGVVVAEAWFGVVCPLTSLEMWLRSRAQATTYTGGFIEHWLSRFLYYDAPPWVFTAVYSLFALAVAATWWRFPPRRSRSEAADAHA